ncbi:hypothetical protein PGT21_019423 [Puccinia graminis f. sp. tritici]|uniref:JmjC domain-containing protein n=1 Tax=Puccinia graminis f. sp. tritici TaxID=56615 RepID=A0A5B0MLX1_PUCGR|nr:hypothetical protein PGT21_019423 [Puccinia graminis f. sp. tritici]
MGIHWKLTELWSRIRDFCDLEQCERSIQFQLKTTCDSLLKQFQDAISLEESQRACEETVATAEALLILSDEKLSSYVYKEVPTHWRQLYTDSILLKVSSIFACETNISTNGRNPIDWMEMIRLLDMALIISGAPGRGRRTVIFFLLDSIQTNYIKPSKESQDSGERPEKRRRKTLEDRPPGGSNPVSIPLVMNAIPVFTAAPTVEEFQKSSHRSPFVIKGYCKDWKALSTNPWESTDYLKAVAGPGRVVPVEVGKTYAEEDWSQTIMGWEDFLNKMHECNPDKLVYLAQYNLFNQFPKLKDDIQLPEYVYCDLPPDDRPKPDVEDGVILNVWLGPAGTVSPAHVDPYYNCYAQVVGRKYVWVAAPKFSTEMYPFGTPTSDQESGRPEEVIQDRNTLQANYMTNTSQVDVFGSVDQDRLAEFRGRFPQFVDKVMPEALQIVLEEGDMLVMPPGWWHSMKSLKPSINLSMWF